MRNRSFLALCFLVLVNQMGFGVITPVLPSYARSFGLSGGAVGLVIGSYGLARFLANVPAGHLAERRGRRQVIILGTAITSIAAALIATATSLTLLLAYRLLAGLGAATVLTAGQIMVGDIATAENRGRMMSLYQGFFLIGVGVGPLPGGLLYDHLGFRAPFVAYAVFSTLACAVALLFIQETRPAAAPPALGIDVAKQPQPDELVPSLRSVVFSPAFMLIGAVSFVQFWGRTGALFTVVPLLGRERLGLSASAIGVALTVVNLLNIATLYHSGSLSDRYGRKAVIVPATFIAGLSMVTFAIGGSYALFLASAALWGTGSGLAGPSPAAYVADLAPPARRGQVWGIYRSIADAGYVAGPILLGWLADVTGYRTPLLITAAMMFVSGALFARLAPELHRRPQPVTASSAPNAEGASPHAHG